MSQHSPLEVGDHDTQPVGRYLPVDEDVSLMHEHVGDSSVNPHTSHGHDNTSSIALRPSIRAATPLRISAVSRHSLARFGSERTHQRRRRHGGEDIGLEVDDVVTHGSR